jgi:hypothetical protein
VSVLGCGLGSLRHRSPQYCWVGPWLSGSQSCISGWLCAGCSYCMSMHSTRKTTTKCACASLSGAHTSSAEAWDPHIHPHPHTSHEHI